MDGAIFIGPQDVTAPRSAWEVTNLWCMWLSPYYNFIHAFKHLCHLGNIAETHFLKLLKWCVRRHMFKMQNPLVQPKINLVFKTLGFPLDTLVSCFLYSKMQVSSQNNGAESSEKTNLFSPHFSLTTEISLYHFGTDFLMFRFLIKYESNNFLFMFSSLVVLWIVNQQLFLTIPIIFSTKLPISCSLLSWNHLTPHRKLYYVHCSSP